MGMGLEDKLQKGGTAGHRETEEERPSPKDQCGAWGQGRSL